jgi:radical SAM protein with 4Fe4S-binding SPASM domain
VNAAFDNMQGTPYSFFIQWHVTELCNLKCHHCYQHEQVSELDYSQICDGIQDIYRAIESWTLQYKLDISPSIHFTGGEPLLRKDLFRIISYARDLGFSVSLMSNGILINDAIAKKIKENKINDVQISLDGLESIHDSIRGKGSFSRTVEGITCLVSHGVDTNINLTLSSLNYNQIDGVIEMLTGLGVNCLSISRLVPCGSGNALKDKMLRADELTALYKSLHKSREIQLISRDPLATVANFEGDVEQVDFPVGGCAAGIFGITIASDGNIMPCRRMDLTIGNITTQSFRELWSESEILWSLRDRSAYTGKCGNCVYWSICRGCRAVALAVSRDNGRCNILADDPQCGLYKPVK